jgi:hypothetical protein
MPSNTDTAEAFVLQSIGNKQAEWAPFPPAADVALTLLPFSTACIMYPPPPLCFSSCVQVLEQPSGATPNTKRPEILTLLNQFYSKALEIQKAIPPGQNDIMMYMGSDFGFKNAPMWYDWLDKLVHYANREGVMNVMYSTPERFLAAKKAAAGVAADGSSGGSIGASSSSSREGGISVMHIMPEKTMAADKAAAGKTAEGAAAAADGSSGGGSSGGGSSGGSNVRWPLRSDDFLPYRCDQGKAWTGEGAPGAYGARATHPVS